MVGQNLPLVISSLFFHHCSWAFRLIHCLCGVPLMFADVPVSPFMLRLVLEYPVMFFVFMASTLCSSLSLVVPDYLSALFLSLSVPARPSLLQIVPRFALMLVLVLVVLQCSWLFESVPLSMCLS